MDNSDTTCRKYTMLSEISVKTDEIIFDNQVEEVVEIYKIRISLMNEFS